MKEIAVKWSKMSDADKEPYIRLAHKDKKRYLAEKKQFLEFHKQNNMAPFNETKKKKKKRKAMTPYLLFAAEIRKTIKKEDPYKSPAEIMKDIAEKFMKICL